MAVATCPRAAAAEENGGTYGAETSSGSRHRALSSEVYTVRFGLPLLGVIGSKPPNGLRALGIGVGVRFIDLVEIEVAMAAHAQPACLEYGKFPLSISARTGVSVPLSKEWRVPVLADYTHGWSPVGCYESPDVRVDSIGGGTGIDATFGRFNVRFLSIVGWGWYSTGPAPWWPLDYREGVRFDVALEIGASFRRTP